MAVKRRWITCAFYVDTIIDWCMRLALVFNRQRTGKFALAIEAAESSRQARKPVPAGTSHYSLRSMNKTVSTLLQKPRTATGWVRKWTIKWRLWVCCSLSKFHKSVQIEIVFLQLAQPSSTHRLWQTNGLRITFHRLRFFRING